MKKYLNLFTPSCQINYKTEILSGLTAHDYPQLPPMRYSKII